MSLENWINLKEELAWKGNQVEVLMLLQRHQVNGQPCTDLNCKYASEAYHIFWLTACLWPGTYLLQVRDPQWQFYYSGHGWANQGRQSWGHLFKRSHKPWLRPKSKERYGDYLSIATLCVIVAQMVWALQCCKVRHYRTLKMAETWVIILSTENLFFLVIHFQIALISRWNKPVAI